MSKLKWIFFDVGSTLVDEIECYKQRLEKIAEAGGVEPEYVFEKAKELYKQNRRGDLEIANMLHVDLPKWTMDAEKLYPEAEGRKIILWAPTFRGAAGDALVQSSESIGEKQVDKLGDNDTKP